MKQLSKEQLENYVYDTALEVSKSNLNDLNKNISNAVKETNDFSFAIVNALAVYGAEIIKECSQVLVETLYNIFYEEGEQ